MIMKLHKIDEKKFTYSVTKTHKISYFIFALFILIGFASQPEGIFSSMSSFIPLLFLLICLVGIGYREEWNFDRETRKVSSLIGVFFIVRKREYSCDDIQAVEISHFTRGYRSQPKKAGDRGRNKSMTVFSLRMTDDQLKQIEIIPERTSRGRVHNNAVAIASFMNLPFSADRDYDKVNAVQLSDL